MFLEMQAHKKRKSNVDDVVDNENARAYQVYMGKSIFVVTEVLKIISFLGRQTPYNVTDSTFNGAKLSHSFMNTIQILRDLLDSLVLQTNAEKQMVELDSDGNEVKKLCRFVYVASSINTPLREQDLFELIHCIQKCFHIFW